jgi:hypothetical protein
MMRAYLAALWCALLWLLADLLDRRCNPGDGW